jgi:hypothetical protein
MFVFFGRSVRHGNCGEGTVSNKLFFGEYFLEYIDSFFCYLPFYSKCEADKTRGTTESTSEQCAQVRTRLQEDHRKPDNQPILTHAWENYVASAFELPHSAGSDNIVHGDECIIAMLDDDELQVAAAPCPPEKMERLGLRAGSGPFFIKQNAMCAHFCKFLN